MELFFRKYFWTVNLLFILLAGILAARTVNQFVDHALSPVPSANASKQIRASAVEATTPLDLPRLAKLTGLKLPEPEVEVKEPTELAVDLNAAPVKTGLRVKLLGTLLAGKPEWSIASIQDVVTLRSVTYMIGDLIQGAKVVEIERARVIILNNSRREFIDGQPGDGSNAYVPPTPAPQVAVANTAPPPSSGMGAGIRAVSENEYEIPRQEIDRTLSNLNDVAMQARIVPAFQDGVAKGFKLFSIRPDSIYTKIGIQNGDVIRRINGYDLNSPEKALEIYSKLKESSRIDIEVERNGSVLRKTYNVR